ncbi:hypothetical protein TWF694_003969 [Orbilia ellipsospora]|uniref:Replicase polyprotein 1a n=1 Tax=Orbilia ellipsospora TaxID=2528407 RepID=A0AAV9WWI9_9PEZI
MMSLGLPTLVPRDTQSLWYTPSHTFGYTAPPKPSSSNVAQANQQQPQPTTQHGHHHQHRTQRDATRSALAAYGPSSLQQLAIDEDAVRKRRLHIARFGATWIKPPGMMKTLQGLIDEELERAEQMVMDDDGGITVTQDVLDPGPQHVEVGEEGEEEEEGEEGEGGLGLDLEVDGGEEGLMEEGEVDLDADIPEADSTGWSDGEDDEDEEEEEDDEEVDEEGDEEEADLDDDIPEAEEVSIYEEDEEEEEDDDDDDDEGEEEEGQGEEETEVSDAEVDELSAIADTTQGSVDDSYVSEIGDGSPHPITPAHGHGRRGTPTPTPSGRPIFPGQGQNRRGFRVQPVRGSPLGRQRVATPTTRTTRRSRGSQAANSSIMFMSGDEMEVDE